jgi:hypothetical protein
MFRTASELREAASLKAVESERRVSTTLSEPQAQNGIDDIDDRDLYGDDDEEMKPAEPIPIKSALADDLLDQENEAIRVRELMQQSFTSSPVWLLLVRKTGSLEVRIL